MRQRVLFFVSFCSPIIPDPNQNLVHMYILPISFHSACLIPKSTLSCTRTQSSFSASVKEISSLEFRRVEAWLQHSFIAWIFILLALVLLIYRLPFWACAAVIVEGSGLVMERD